MNDVRPPGLNMKFRPGTTVTLTLSGWPPGSLAGRLFQAFLGVDALSVTINGDVMTIVIDNLITDNYDNEVALFVLNEQIASTYEPIIIGRWTPSNNPRETVSASQAFQLVVGAATVTVNMAHDTSKVSRTGDTMTGDLILDGSADLLIGGLSGVRFQYQAGTIDSVLMDGQLLSAHDARYAWANDMQSNGTLVPESAQDVGLPRWSLANAATQRVKWMWEIPAEWDSVAIRFGWNKEAAGSGNVVFQYAYQLVYPFASTDIDAGAVTTIAIPAIAVSGTTFGIVYQIPTEISAIATADGAFGSKPFIMSSLSRLGADAADTYTGAIAVSLATMTRVS